VELEEELAGLREQLAELRAPDRVRMDQLELELVRERQLLAATRTDLGQSISSVLTKDKVGFTVFFLAMVIIVAMVHYC